MSTASPTDCPHCGNFHDWKCPLIKSFEYHENGILKQITFFSPVELHGPDVTAAMRLMLDNAMMAIFPGQLYGKAKT